MKYREELFVSIFFLSFMDFMLVKFGKYVQILLITVPVLLT